MKILNLMILLCLLIFTISCNVASIITDAQTHLDPNLFNIGQKYFKVAGVCNTNSKSQLCIFDSKGAFLAETAIGGSGYSANVQNVYGFNGAVYFSADDGVVGSELYKMSFSASSATLVADLNSGVNSGLPQNFTDDGSKLYFIASDGGAAALICTYTGSGSPSCTAISSGAGTGSIYSMKYINGKLFLCNGATLQILTPSSGVETAVSGGGICDYTMFNDGRYIYATSGTTLYIYDTTNDVETTFNMGGTQYIVGAMNGYVYLTDFSNLSMYNVATAASNVFIGGHSQNSDRYTKSDGGKLYFIMYDGSMDQIMSTSPGGSSYNTLTSFNSSQNSFLQIVSIRDFFIIGGRILAAVEAPVSNTGLWVTDTFDGETYKISGSETFDPYKPYAVHY